MFMRQVTTGEEEELVGQILSEVTGVDEKTDWWIGGNNHADQVIWSETVDNAVDNSGRVGLGDA